MGGILAVLVGLAAKLSARLTIGSSGGTLGYLTGAFGTLSPSAIPAATVDAVEWDNNASGFVLFKLHGTSVANSDATFRSINIDGNVLTRASSAYTANDGLGHTQWAWSPNTSGYPNTGTKSFIVQ
jgi:hypothetical protein